MPGMAAVAAAHQSADKLERLSTKSFQKAKKAQLQEERRASWSPMRKWLYRELHSHMFEAICGVIILFNMVLVVIETDISTDPDAEPPLWVNVATKFMLAFYSCELFSKIFALRCMFFEDTWNILDFVIVGVDLSLFVLSLILDKLPSVSVLRVFRLIRLARAVKAASFFKELHSLIRSFGCALKAIFWGMIMVLLALTIWGILAVQLIHPVNLRVVEEKPWIYEGCDRCHRSFETVFDSALTFWKQLVAGDSWGQVSEPIIEEAPWTSLFLMSVAVTVNLMLLNLILAVIVEAGSAAAAQDEAERAAHQATAVEKAEEALIDFCRDLDGDSSGSLNKAEFLGGYHDNVDFRRCLQTMHVTETDMQMIFTICDEDDSGDVDYREFVEQIRRIKHSSEQLVLSYLTEVRHKTNKIFSKLLPDYIAPGDNYVRPPESEEKFEAKDEGAYEEGNGTDVLATPQIQSDEKFQCKVPSAEEAAVVVPAVSTGIGNQKLERIAQVNEDLVKMMADVAQQSKAQSTLLNTLVERTATDVSLTPRTAGLKLPIARPAPLLDSDVVSPSGGPPVGPALDAFCGRSWSRQSGGGGQNAETGGVGLRSSELLVAPSQWVAPPACLPRIV